MHEPLFCQCRNIRGSAQLMKGLGSVSTPEDMLELPNKLLGSQTKSFEQNHGVGNECNVRKGAKNRSNRTRAQHPQRSKGKSNPKR